MSKLACLVVLSLVISVIVGVAQADPDADAKIQSQSQPETKTETKTETKAETETATEPEIFFDDELFGDRSFFGGSFKNAISTDTKIPTVVSTTSTTTTTTTSTTFKPEPESPRPPAAVVSSGQSVISGQVNAGGTSQDKIVTTDDLDENLLQWEAPLWFRQNIPYYLSGHDDDGRPVWISEIGKYPLKQLAELGPADSQILDTYISQLALRMLRSIQAQNTTEREVTDGFIVLDFDGFTMSQLTSPKSVLIIVRIFRAYSGLLINYLGVCIAINVNYVADFALSLAKPVLGRAADKLEVFGTNPVKWKSVLRNRLPQEAIPSWYGGPQDFRPLKVYG